MTKGFLGWAAAMMVSLMGTGLAMKLLALDGISTGQSLFGRGCACLVLVVLFAVRQKLTLKVKSPSTQMIRAVVAGLALTFYTISYAHISASAVSVLSNIDVPLLIALGPIVGVRNSRLVRGAALLSILFLMMFVWGMDHSAITIYGLSYLLVGTLMLCFGYQFIKLSMAEENQAVAVMVPALAIMAFGLVQMLYYGESWQLLTAKHLTLTVISGSCMFFAYYATMQLYRIADIATAEFPTLLSSLLIQPIEFFLTGEATKSIYVVSTIGFIVTTYIILRWQHQTVKTCEA